MSNPRQWVHDALQGEGSTFRHAVGVDPAKAMHRLKNAEVFSGSSNPVLAEEVAYELHRPLGKMEITRYADGEISVKVLDSVRGKDVFVVQSTSQPVNENLMELLLTVSTMRRASAKSITAVIPYMGYKRDTGSSASTTQQLLLDQMAAAVETAPNVDISEMLSSVETGADTGNGGGSSCAGEPVPGTAEYLISQPKQNRSAFPVSAADVAAMLEVMGVDRIITVDLQLPGQGQSEVCETEPSSNCASTFSVAADMLACEANRFCHVLVNIRIVGNAVPAGYATCIAIVFCLHCTLPRYAPTPA
jgi:phosphoribosylpyrophosphate synthetase